MKSLFLFSFFFSGFAALFILERTLLGKAKTYTPASEKTGAVLSSLAMLAIIVYAYRQALVVGYGWAGVLVVVGWIVFTIGMFLNGVLHTRRWN